MGRKILLIEDESSIADTILYALESEGFQTLWKQIGHEGAQMILEEYFDLVVLDVGLPDESGFEICKKIRRTSDVPVLFLTARTEEIDRVVGLEIGGDDYMTKPFSPREMVARIKAILRRGRKEERESMREEDRIPFVINAEKAQIFYQGESLDLSRYEFRVLKILVDRPGRIYSRGQLMDMAWESPETSLDRTVDAHIKSIRSKFRQINPHFDPIQTHRGMGYSLKEEL